MKNRLIAVVSIGSLLMSTSVSGSPEDLFQRLVENQKIIDSDNIASKGIPQALQANCDVTTALQAAMVGDRKTFGPALSDAENNLRATIKNLAGAGQYKPFNRPVKLPPSLLPQISSLTASSITGNDVIQEIVKLSTQSADALQDIRVGKGGQDQLETVIRNNGLITQLVFAFYSSIQR